MYQKNRLYILIMLTVLVFSCLLSMPEARAEAATVPQEKETSGYATLTGKNIQWTFDTSTKTLSFTGTGKIMSNETSQSEVMMEKLIGSSDTANGMERGTWYIWREETEHIVIGEGITEIGHGDFAYFEHLIDVSLPDSLRVIENSAFEGSSLKSITIPDGVKQINGFAFIESALNEITGMNGVKWFGYYAFSKTQLEEFIFPKSNCDLGDGLFYGCKRLRKVTLSSNVKSLWNDTFGDCTSLKEIEMPNSSLTTIGDMAFAGCCIPSIKLPQSVVRVNAGAFRDTKLKTIELPKNVKIIGRSDTWADGRVFEGSNKLKTLRIKSRKLKKVYPNAFKKFPSKATIIVPKGKKESYSKMFYKAGLSKKIKIKESKKW